MPLITDRMLRDRSVNAGIIQQMRRILCALARIARKQLAAGLAVEFTVL